MEFELFRCQHCSYESASQGMLLRHVAEMHRTAAPENYIQTTGGHFSLTDPLPEQVRLDSISLSLSHLNRFSGHTRAPYSVAQHSVLVALWLITQDAPRHRVLGGLYHDAHEAYIGDVSSPVKKEVGPTFKALEERVQRVVAKGLGIAYECLTHQDVRSADLMALLIERDHLLPEDPEPWPEEKLVPYESARMLFPWYGTWSPAFSRFAFLRMAALLQHRPLPAPASILDRVQRVVFEWRFKWMLGKAVAAQPKFKEAVPAAQLI